MTDLPEWPPLPPLPGDDAPVPVKVDNRRRTADGRVLPPNAGMGKKPGSVNKTTKTLKEAILLAGEAAGDRIAKDIFEKDGKEHPGGLLGYLTVVATTDVKSFCTLLGRVLPMTLKGEGDDGKIVVEIVKRTYADEA